ncbi:MAG: YbhB/YbcL family Raf kinase inhibitor-like protein [Bdellovibrio sp.]
MKSNLIALVLFLTFSQAWALTVTTNVNEKNKKDMNRFVYNGFGCKGENHSPEITWKDAPKETKSFAVTIFDTDAPTGSGWWHWTVFNIPATVTKLDENVSGDKSKFPKGAVEGRTDYGKSGYGGPCPPPGDKPHRYVVTVYAMKVPTVDLNQDSSGAMVGFNLNNNSITKATVTFNFGR